MRVLILSPKLSGAFGQERVIRDSSSLLRAAGNQVFLVGGAAGENVPEVDGICVAPELLEGNSFYHRARARKSADTILKTIDSFHPDVVHLVDIFDTELVSALAEEFPAVSTAHLFSHTCPSSTRMLEKDGGYQVCDKKGGLTCVLHHQRYHCMSGFRNNAVRAHVAYEFTLKQKAQKKLKAVIAISRHMQKTLLENHYPAGKVRLIYNPVQIPERPSLKEKLPENLLVCASRLVKHKGVSLLLEALSGLKVLNWTLWVMGEGAEKEACERLAQSLGISSRVSFLGQVSYERVQEIFSGSKILVQPNLGPEPFGLSVAEASSLGVPVIASRVPALDEVVEHEKTGLLFSPGHKEGLRESISRLISDGALWTRLSENGPASIRARFSPEEHLRRTLETYRLAMHTEDLPSQAATKKSLGSSHSRSLSVGKH